MARPDKAERARRQKIAKERRLQQEIEADEKVASEEAEQIRLAEIAEAEELDRRTAEAIAQENAEYADRAVKALDELSRLLAHAQESGEPIEDDEIQEILAAAGHPDHLRERPVPACSSGCCFD